MEVRDRRKANWYKEHGNEKWILGGDEGGSREIWYWINYSFPNYTKVQRDLSNDGDVLIAHLFVPSVSKFFAKEQMEMQYEGR